MKTTLLLAISIILMVSNVNSQVAINKTGNNPDPSAMLDVEATDAGFLAPRMSNAQRDAISSPATGLIIFSTDDNTFNYYNGTNWSSLGGNDEDWIVSNNHLLSIPTGNVGIGTNNPLSKLSVGDTGSVNYTISGIASGSSLAGVYGEATTQGAPYRYGVWGRASGSTSNGNRGVAGFAQGTQRSNEGVYGEAIASIPQYSGNNYGVSGIASSSNNNNYGIYGTGSGDVGVKYGVYGSASGAGTNYGVYGYASGGTNNWAGYFEGQLYAAGYTGIGTTNPAHLLHLYSTTDPRLVIESPSGENPNLALKRGSTTHLMYVNSENDLIFYKDNSNVTFTDDGKVGIGSVNPAHKLHIYGSSNPRLLIQAASDSPPELNLQRGSTTHALYINSGNDLVWYNAGDRMAFTDNGNVGIGTTNPIDNLHIHSSNNPGVTIESSGVSGPRLSFREGTNTYDMWSSSGNIYFSGNGGTQNIVFQDDGKVGIGVNTPQSSLDVKGNIIIRDNSSNVVLELGTGLDYAEGFNVSDNYTIEPGSVLCIDSNTPGKLKVATTAYDKKVAGIIAGANNLGSGVRLGSGQFDYDVALAGRVYCFVDASKNAIQPGDLLTTSDTPGYAMKVVDHKKAQGAIIGKAMESLGKGEKGQILVLVTLQ